ncbi:YheC/YheD family protein [Paenibacillus aurantius]|uniref:YheC/YheD family protein n=1 Tax=Paenibacillus aurantius TaxID=2918900 RepID=A0AA96LA59_9BACL|nr:YheC/YheD family protein [Paenibacillus aurantius]WNQ09969.1 YheC/YheD family protein [Paenibacillus aurantius]
MSLASCTILITQQTDRSIALTRSLSKALQLGTAKTVNLRLGSKNVTVALKPLNRKGNLLVIPASVATSIRLPSPGKCQVKATGNRELQIGPLIGFLTGINIPDGKPGQQKQFIREFLEAGHDRSYTFAFSPSGVNWRDEVVTGYFPLPGGKWVRRTVPLPDVVYNRLGHRGAEKTMSIREFKERFVSRRIPIFNWSFFDKMDVYRLLEDDLQAFSHVPESSSGPSPEEIRRMMEKHRFVYLKPTAGSLGFGIYRLTYNPEKGYFARYRKDGSNVLIRFPRFEGLMNMLRRQNIRLPNYVVQQGIRLIELDNCPIDFRFHMTKNGEDEWVVAAVGAKKAGRGSVTTHVRTGGMLMTPEQVLSTVYGSRGADILVKAKEVAVKLAEAIERNYPHRLGELGFDLGIDQDETIWMFEANAKPGRSIFKHPALKVQGKESLNNLVEHCLFLSRFRARRES